MRAIQPNQYQKNIIIVNNSEEKREEIKKGMKGIFNLGSIQQSCNEFPQFENSKNYYQDFWKLYLQNELLMSTMKDEVSQIKLLKQQIQVKEEEIQNRENLHSQKMHKKNRRIAAEIQKNHQCPYQNCGKSYGSEVSLNLHIKLKHGGGTKTERENLAKKILNSSKNDIEDDPTININFPPGYLHKYMNIEHHHSQDENQIFVNEEEKNIYQNQQQLEQNDNQIQHEQ